MFGSNRSTPCVCFKCRICFADASYCPNCHSVMENMYFGFKAPRREAITKWRKAKEGKSYRAKSKNLRGQYQRWKDAIDNIEKQQDYKEWYRLYLKIWKVDRKNINHERLRFLKKMKLNMGECNRLYKKFSNEEKNSEFRYKVKVDLGLTKKDEEYNYWCW